jgi:sodium transport system permease protein
MKGAIRTVAGKEIVDNLRDRRAMSTALIMPLMGPLTMLAFFFALKDAEEKSRAPKLPVIGRENAPELVQWLERQGTSIVVLEGRDGAPPDGIDDVASGTYDAVLRIPPTFGDELRKGAPAVVEVVCDPSRQSAMATIGRVEGLLAAYGGQIGSLRLMARGVDPGIVSAVRAERVDVGGRDAKKALLLASLPLFLLMAAFVGGTYVAIDLTAGERERGSLESLLLNPVRTSSLVIAKVLATIVFGALATIVGLLAFSFIVPAVPFAEIGIDLEIPPLLAVKYAVLFLPTIVLAAALQVFVGTLSKTTKTAQAALGILVIGPMLPGVIVSLFPQQPSLWKCMVPCFGESILALRLLRGEPVELVHWLANAGSDLAIAAVLIAVTTKIFGARMLSS